jgi:hypothetical protein
MIAFAIQQFPSDSVNFPKRMDRENTAMNDLWASWVGSIEPSEFLRQADRAVAASLFPSRRDVFLDFADRALRARQPDVPDEFTAESLAEDLQEYAESSESVSP